MMTEETNFLSVFDTTAMMLAELSFRLGLLSDVSRTPWKPQRAPFGL